MLRIAATLIFFLFVPGLACTWGLPFETLLHRLVLGAALSISIDTLVATSLAYLRWSSPDLLVSTAAISILGAAVNWAFVYRSKERVAVFGRKIINVVTNFPRHQRGRSPK